MDARRTVAVAVTAALVMGTGSVAIASVVDVSITPGPVTARIVTETRPYTVVSTSIAAPSTGAQH